MRRLAIALVPIALACAPPQTMRYSANAPTSSRLVVMVAGQPETAFPDENLYEFLRRTQPLYLRPRSVSITPPSAFDPPIGVYVNGQFLGGIEELQMIPVRQVSTVRRISAAEASVAFPRKHSSGVVDVRLR